MKGFVFVVLCLVAVSMGFYDAPDPQTVMKVVLASPEAAGRHDREGWLSLFSPDGFVEDPVGTSVHTGTEELAKFYDCFIEPNNVTFYPHFDVVAGWYVARFVNISAETLSTGTVSNDPAIVLYTLKPDAQGNPRLASLEAHWELAVRVSHLLKQKGASKTLASQGARLVKYFGIKGSVEYAKGFTGIKETGKKATNKFFQTLSTQSKQEWLDLMTTGLHGQPEPTLELLYQKNTVSYAGSTQLEKAWDELVVGGAMQFAVGEVYAAGYRTAATLQYKASSGSTVNVISVFEFHAHSKRIQRARIFLGI